MFCFIWNGVPTPWIEGVAAENPLYRQETALAGTMQLNRFDGIVRTGWVEPAGLGKKRRDQFLVELDYCDKYEGKELGNTSISIHQPHSSFSHKSALP